MPGTLGLPVAVAVRKPKTRAKPGAKKVAKPRARPASAKPTKVAARKARRTPAKRPKTSPPKPATPTFGRAGTAGKADGAAAVQAWIAGVKPEHRELATRFDSLVGRAVPDVKRAVKWSMPMYGRAGMGWFAHIGSFKEHVAIGFFAGTELVPPPPEGEGGRMRRINIHGPDEYDERQISAWLVQASQLQGWGKA